MQHNDLHTSRIAKDEKDVQSLLSTLEGWTNPFHDQSQELICLSTGKKATEEITRDLLQAKAVGESAYRAFSKERLEPNDSEVKFHDKMSKTKLKTFSQLHKKIKVGKGTKEVVLKADRALFAHMIVIAEARKLSIKEVLKHPLGPIPWSLATPDGSLRKTTKSTLAKELQKNVPEVESMQQSACIIDGMAMVQKVKGDLKTFADIADSVLTMALREGFSSARIDVVFDVYREISIKNIERFVMLNLCVKFSFLYIHLRCAI